MTYLGLNPKSGFPKTLVMRKNEWVYIKGLEQTPGQILVLSFPPMLAVRDKLIMHSCLLSEVELPKVRPVLLAKSLNLSLGPSIPKALPGLLFQD